MSRWSAYWQGGAALLLASLCGVVWAVDPVPSTNGPTTGAAREQLARLNPLIGGWRGVGQPLRGSNKGAWTETADWVWNLRGESPAIDYVVTEGKLLKQASLTWNVSSKRYELTAVLSDETKRLYTGDWEAGKLVLTSGEAGGVQQRVIVTPLNEKRTLVFFGEKAKGADEFRRVAEVGYTRAGTRLAVEGAGEPVCIVTGGKGTSTVTYKGQTYYVCCSGCRDAFNDDPEGVLAEAAERAKKK